ncbi:AAC(3) family N-acetyltransferase [Burkholderiaceae bacterium DAT-1]|nr:AAC(3) family N-acetyltransferase [Burkholderiaceae bacterium DAT-1]
MAHMQIDAHSFQEALTSCGIQPGDTLMLHADALAAMQIRTGTPSEKMDTLLDGVLAALGSTGTLIMPTFTYSATKGEVFDPELSPSTVGQLTELFRLRSGVKRSVHPIFSVAAYGAKADDYACSVTEDSFGPGTAFDLLNRDNAWIACLACCFDRITFVHYVEQYASVDYRFFKSFPSQILRDGQIESGSVRYLVRHLDRQTVTHLDTLKTELQRTGQLHTADIGRAQLLCVRARDFLNTALGLMKQQPNVLIEEGACPTTT